MEGDDEQTNELEILSQAFLCTHSKSSSSCGGDMNKSRGDGRGGSDGRNGMENSNFVPHISTAKRLRLEREAVLGGDSIDSIRT